MKASSHPVTEYTSKLSRLARENPMSTVLVAVGCGLAVGLLVRTLRPPQSRTARLLAAVRGGLHDIAEPVRRQTEHLVESGTDAVKSGVAHLQDLHLERGIRNLGKRFKSFFR